MQRDFEASVQSVYQAALRPGDTAVDVGAHIGHHAIPMAAVVAPGGRVYAIEPLPHCREALANALTYHHPELKPVVTIEDYALGNYEGEAEFIVAVDAPWFSGLRERIYDQPTQLQKLPVKVHTIDNTFMNLPALHYIKVDAEGGEYHIFQGAKECLRKFRPLVTFEFGINTIEHYGITCLDMGELWHGLDYRLYDINGNALPTPQDFALAGERMHCWDYVAVPAENAGLDATVREALKDQKFS